MSGEPVSSLQVRMPGTVLFLGRGLSQDSFPNYRDLPTQSVDLGSVQDDQERSAHFFMPGLVAWRTRGRKEKGTTVVYEPVRLESGQGRAERGAGAQGPSQRMWAGTQQQDQKQSWAPGRSHLPVPWTEFSTIGEGNSCLHIRK